MRFPRTPSAAAVAVVLVSACAAIPGASPPEAASSRADALNVAGVAHSLRGRAAAAEQAFREALALEPRSIRAHNNLGYHLLAAGRAQEALPYLEQAVALAPGDERAQVNLRQARAELARVQAQREAAARAAERESLAQEAAAREAAPSAGLKPTVTMARIADGVYELRNAVTAAMGAAAPAVPLQLVPALQLPPKTRLEVSNGNGATGLARRVSAWLGETARHTNSQPYGVRPSRIEYVPAAEDAARALKARLPVAVPLARVARLDRADVRLVLGKDFPRQPGPPVSQPETKEIP
ncbi:MAG: LytR C-terminal domain-containing protein [Burkholderiales bacterium]|nr:LytR C-terminal domain-containing protein [Burkholderiales bacterium]